MEAYFKQINTLDLKAKLRIAMQGHTINDQLDALHSLSKEKKAINRARINDVVKGIRVSERPDELNLKAD